MKPYFDDGTVALYLGDMREVIPDLGLHADLIVADPPFQETSLAWDRWPDGWLDVAVTVTSSLWCFGSMRMFLDRRDEFAAWKLSQDVVGRGRDGEPIYGDVDVIWEKHNPTGLRADRFRRIHEQVTHWYRGPWGDTHKQPQWVTHVGPRTADRGGLGRRPQHWEYDGRPPLGAKGWTDNGTRLATSVITVRGMHMRAIHPSEKPIALLTPLIEYACPPGGLVVDPFAGSGSTLEAARLTGRRAIGIEAHEPYLERAALRLAQAPLEAM